MFLLSSLDLVDRVTCIRSDGGSAFRFDHRLSDLVETWIDISNGKRQDILKEMMQQPKHRSGLVSATSEAATTAAEGDGPATTQGGRERRASSPYER